MRGGPSDKSKERWNSLFCILCDCQDTIQTKLIFISVLIGVLHYLYVPYICKTCLDLANVILIKARDCRI